MTWRRISGQSVLEAYEGDNLRVLLYHKVERILFSGARATGVEVRRATRVDGGTKPPQLAAERQTIPLVVDATPPSAAGNGGRLIPTQPEVVLCGNVYETPVLLQRSGVGPASVLARIGADAHPQVPAASADMVGRHYWNNQYLNRLQSVSIKPGRLRQGGYDKWVRSAHLMTATGSGGRRHVVRIDHKTTSYDAEDATVLADGVVEEDSPDPRARLGWDAHDTVRDRAQMYLDSLQMVLRRSGDTVSFTNVPPASMPSLAERWSENADLVGIVENDFRTGENKNLDSVHYGGTCSIGTVVDATTLKVAGLENVRVADLSLFPANLPANTMAPAYTIARYATRYVMARHAPELSDPAQFGQRLTQLREVHAQYPGWTLVVNLDLSGLDVLTPSGPPPALGVVEGDLFPSVRMHASGRLDFDVGAVVDGVALPKENCIVPQRCSRFLGLTSAIYDSRAASSVLIEVFLDGQSNAPVPADPAELFAVESIGGNVTRVRLDDLDVPRHVWTTVVFRRLDNGNIGVETARQVYDTGRAHRRLTHVTITPRHTPALRVCRMGIS